MRIDEWVKMLAEQVEESVHAVRSARMICGSPEFFEFDIGVDIGGNVSEDSPNRVRFRIPGNYHTDRED